MITRYRQLLKLQVEEKEREKQAEKRKQKEIQEQELRELIEYERVNGKGVSVDKKVRASERASERESEANARKGTWWAPPLPPCSVLAPPTGACWRRRCRLVLYSLLAPPLPLRSVLGELAFAASSSLHSVRR